MVGHFPTHIDKCILPVVVYFDILSFEELGDISVKKDSFHIYVEDKNKFPQGYSRNYYESKGFISSKQIQDFPVRGKAVYLHIKTSPCRDKKIKKIEIRNDYSFIVEGSKLTSEISAFLKNYRRDPAR